MQSSKTERRVREIVITGASGFIGSRLVRAMLADSDFEHARITLVDQKVPDIGNERVQSISGSIADPAVADEITRPEIDLFYHLAGILGGTAETDYPLSREVNVDATLTLFEKLRRPESPCRLVFASTIAVFGAPLPSRISDDTIPRPTMSYGAQKLMMEVALEQFSRRGWIDALALRLPGIVAREGADSRLKSAFLNAIFYAYAAGEDYSLPVSPDGTTWLISVPACVEAFLHAGKIATERLGSQRAFTLPAMNVTIRDLVAALSRRFPDSRSNVSYSPDPQLEAQFTRWPPLTTRIADSLGFRHDGDLDTLVERAFEN